MSTRQATALATALAETGTVPPEIARLRGIASSLASPGSRRKKPDAAPAKAKQNQIADELRPAIEAVLDDLDAWLTPAADRPSRNRVTEAAGSPATRLTGPPGRATSPPEG